MTEEKSTKFTWEEVAKHNREDDLWVTIDGKVYDITSWVDRHPGGVEVLRLVAGRDISIAFQNYHPFTKKPYEVLPKFQVGVLREGSYEFPPYLPDKSGFYAEIRSEVDKFFKVGF